MKRRILALLCAFCLLLGAALPAAAAAQTPYEDSRFFTYEDYDIHYRVIPAAGESKACVLLLHGFFCSTFAWRNLAPQLAAAGYTCVLADLPSFGYSTRESKDVAPVAREDLMCALMDAVAPEADWILAGHSMGGGVAINLAQLRPVKALLLYCPAPQSEFPPALQPLITSRPMEALMNAFLNVGTRFTPLVRLVIYAATNDWAFARDYDVEGVTGPVQYDGFGAGVCEMMYRVRPTDLEGAKDIACPVLLVNADHDVIINDSMVSSVRDALPQAQTYLVKGGGHQCIENRADELAQVTLAFLNATE